MDICNRCGKEAKPYTRAGLCDSCIVEFSKELQAAVSVMGVDVTAEDAVARSLAKRESARQSNPLSSEGARRIEKERMRQIQQEGWTPEHDDEHRSEELAWAAVCYAVPGRVLNDLPDDPWPWGREWDKRPVGEPTKQERIRALEKAGALIAAEIDRLLRLA